jgi:hypothetical protein
MGRGDESMFNNTTEYKKAMCIALKCIKSGDKSFSYLYLIYNDIDAYDAIKRCIDLEFIEDMAYEIKAKKIILFYDENPRLSYEGLEFLENNGFGTEDIPVVINTV